MFGCFSLLEAPVLLNTRWNSAFCGHGALRLQIPLAGAGGERWECPRGRVALGTGVSSPLGPCSHLSFLPLLWACSPRLTPALLPSFPIPSLGAGGAQVPCELFLFCPSHPG